MREELPYFYIGNSYGGNQDWFSSFMMRKGGCAAETLCDSCIYFARYFGRTHLYPFEAQSVTKEEYVRFSKIVEPYLKPRMQGIDTLEIYMEGVSKYFENAGEKELTTEPLYGDRSCEEAWKALVSQIQKGYPVPCLVLHHKSPELKEYVWHWFMLTGYEAVEDITLVKAVTYSEFEWLDFNALWDSGHKKKGGLILYHLG